MRSKRTDRRRLKAELARLQRENEQLKQAAAAPPPVSSPAPTVMPDRSEVPDVPLLARGFPTRAAPRTAKTLKEAKEILMNSSEW